MWIDDVFDGMQKFFTEEPTVKEHIQSRMYEVAAEHWVTNLATAQKEASPRAGKWVSYELGGGSDHRLLAGPGSTFQKLFVPINCYALTPRLARELLTRMMVALKDSGGNANNYTGTWGGYRVRSVRFDLATIASTFDESFKQAVASGTLTITVTDAA